MHYEVRMRQEQIGGLMQKIESGTFDTVVRLLDSLEQFVPAKCVLFLFREPALQLPEMLFLVPQMPGTGYVKTVAGIHKIMKSHVYPDCWKFLLRLDFKFKLEGEAGEPLSGLVGYGQGLNPGISRYVPVIADFNLADFRDFDISVSANSNRSIIILWIGDRTPLSPFLEFGKTWSFTIFDSAEETLKCFIESFECILKHLRIYRLVPRTLFLKFRKLFGLIVVVDRLACRLIYLYTFSKRPVVEIAAHGELVQNACLLGSSRIYSVFIGFPDAEFHEG